MGEGSGWDLRVCPAAASGNQGFGHLGIEVEKQGVRTAWLRTGQKFQGVGLEFTACVLTLRDPSPHGYMSKHHESSFFDGFGVGEFLQDPLFFQTLFVLREF